MAHLYFVRILINLKMPERKQTQLGRMVVVDQIWYIFMKNEKNFVRHEIWTSIVSYVCYIYVYTNLACTKWFIPERFSYLNQPKV